MLKNKVSYAIATKFHPIASKETASLHQVSSSLDNKVMSHHKHIC